MIIGIDASRAAKPQKTGTEWYSFYVIEELKKIIQAAPPLPSPPHQGEGKEKAEGESIRFILYSREPLQGDLAELPPNFESRVLKWPPKFLWTQVRLSWEMLVRPPDILFVPAHTVPILGRVKKVVTIHDVGFRVYPELYSWIDILYHRFSVWFASHFAYKIICVSEFTKSELIKYYRTDPKKITVIPLGVKDSDFLEQTRTSPSPLLMRRGLRGGPGLNDQNPFLFFIGRLEKKKNILGILKGFNELRKKFPTLRLVLAGLPGHGFAEIENYLSDQKLWDFVEIRGYVTETEKQELYRGACAFVFPTFYEGFGMPILEAQSLGCPVVTSKYGATAEVAKNSALLVNPQEHAEITEACRKLMEDGSLRESLIAAGLENVKKYTWTGNARKTYPLFLN